MKRDVKLYCEHTDQSKIYAYFHINDKVRKAFFKKFWQLYWSKKRFYVCQHVQNSCVDRPKNWNAPEESSRSQSFKYFLNYEGARHVVCKTFFLNTFNIAEWSICTRKLQQVADQVTPKNTFVQKWRELLAPNTSEKIEHLQPVV